MPNPVRGDVAFTVGGRQMYVRYGTREIAEVQAALGFRRPDPQQADVVEEVDVPVYLDAAGTQQKVDGDGLRVFRRERILVDAKERQRRMVAAFDACLLGPDPASSVTFFRVGLRAWQRDENHKLTSEGEQRIVDALGLEKIRLLHMKALADGCYLVGEESANEAAQGKAESAA